MRRRIAVVGDRLSNGGQVLPAVNPNAARTTFMGHPVALIGEKAFCNVCRTAGFIAKTGGPYRINFFGKTGIALDGDIVICGCPTHPRIVAVLAGESWCDDRLEQTAGTVTRNDTPTHNAPVAPASQPIYDERVKLSGALAVGIPYYIESSDGQKIFGYIDSTGLLPRISSNENAGDHIVYFGDEALAMEFGE
ncbi:MAG: PAAR domain-containing protein [Burkholderia sp.]